MKTQTEMILSEIAKELRLIRKALEEGNKLTRQIINNPASYEDLYLADLRKDLITYPKSRDEHLQEIDEEFNND